MVEFGNLHAYQTFNWITNPVYWVGPSLEDYLNDWNAVITHSTEAI